MPIQFPCRTGSPRSVIESQWLRQMTKSFDEVPAPNLGRVGQPLQTQQSGGPSGWSMSPGTGVSARQAVNVFNPSQVFSLVGQPAQPNPAALIGQMYDQTMWSRDFGLSNNRMFGVSLDAAGVALGGCTVKVFTTVGDVLVATTVSDGAGNWIAYPNAQGPYYLVEYKAGPPNVFGTSDNGLTATPFQPGSAVSFQPVA